MPETSSFRVLGISGSGRSGRITEAAVKTVLSATKEPSRFISLSGLTIGGCRACLGCAGDNRCKLDDDWLEIGDAMLAADAIVFGAPAYYGMINALAHACLERTFAFRHRERFLLSGKLGIAIEVGRPVNDRPPHLYIESLFRSNMMVVVRSIRADGYSQCYTCGYGEDCVIGNVVADHGHIDKIEPYHLPPEFDSQEKAVHSAEKAGRILGAMLRSREAIQPSKEN
jgi:multimeric flavodoxin WrbA